jgi:hypothetical protein
MHVAWSRYLSLAVALLASCATVQDNLSEPVQVPFVKNSSTECYYLDEFMPTPDGLVTGKQGSMHLRYYTYKYATYKDWDRKHIMLSFYSNNDRCWSLFEEYYIPR